MTREAVASKAPTNGVDEMSAAQSDAIAAIFKMLANETRLRLLRHIQQQGEARLTELAAELKLTPQAVSNQLQRLLDRNIVATRRDGNAVHYRIVDPCIGGILDLAVCLIATPATSTVASPAKRR